MDALWQFTLKDPNRNVFEMYCQLESSAAPKWKYNMFLKKDNYTNMEYVWIPKVFGQVRPSAQGTGRAMIQLTTTVNVEYPFQIRNPVDTQLFYLLDNPDINFYGRNFSVIQMTPCVSYTPTVASKIYNYKRFLQCIDLSNPSLHPLPCECSSSDFNYSPYGHVITGDLSIVKNDKLRELLKKGPKYRESMSFTWNQNVKIIMDSCEEYARRWAKKEDVQLDTLSEWIKSIRGLLLSRINRFKSTVNTRFVSIFKDPNVITELTYLQEHYVITPADKASNNYTFTCKKYYFDSLVKELGLNSTPGNPTYTPTNLSASEIIDNHKSALTSFGFDTTNLDLDLPYLYCIPKMHKNPYKQRFIAGSSKCSTKSVSILLTKVLSEIKSGLQKYCSTVYSRSGINQMWILKNSKELLEHLKSSHFSRVHSI
ncbi:hypothetical protein FSP39_024074 [Pinctada imbricata]|uniref:Uncharacterized protein n=1 Tax=Pinctada imbricata TaxID=66713 RepID=A0AA88XJG6_PINIB|nr:hypothetical protein FSP39_024074 [Pinctada imbricata]